MIIGYTSGVFDLFHIGHLNILRNARAMCDKLIVGVSTDELVMEYKSKKPIIPFVERCEIVRGIKYVDSVVAQEDMDKMLMLQKLKFNMLFVGDDWFQNDKWEALEADFAKHDVRVVYFPYTKGVSSTLINDILSKSRKT